uniref:Uncharacterized protein n=1 Tax=Caenorhabditis japonica TaxID=281687 RepID=A0A8R1EJ46_CAEJA
MRVLLPRTLPSGMQSFRESHPALAKVATSRLCCVCLGKRHATELCLHKTRKCQRCMERHHTSLCNLEVAEKKSGTPSEGFR